VSSVASRVMPRASGQIWRMMAHICAMDAPFMRRLCDMACRIWPHGVRPSEGGRPAAADRVEFPHRTGSGPVTRIVRGIRTNPRGETTKRTRRPQDSWLFLRLRGPGSRTQGLGGCRYASVAVDRDAR
jgi:hypothetical protein